MAGCTGNEGADGRLPGLGTQSVLSPGAQKKWSDWGLSIFFGCSHLLAQTEANLSLDNCSSAQI
jgi:hypothetical protein